MRTVAIALTIGRASARGFLGCLARQTFPIPTLLWVDDVPELQVRADVHVVHGPALGSARSIGLVRRAACAYAIERMGADALLFLDDDDYYAPDHYQTLCEALETAEWVGARRFGVVSTGQPPQSVTLADDSLGTGPPSTWGMRVTTYLAGGGYQDDTLEEVELTRRIGRERLTRHDRVTHVRRLSGPHLSITVGYDRAALRKLVQPAVELYPEQPEEYRSLDAWCRAVGG